MSVTQDFEAGRTYRIEHYCDGFDPPADIGAVEVMFGSLCVQRRKFAAPDDGRGYCAAVFTPSTSATVTVSARALLERDDVLHEIEAAPGDLFIDDLGTQ